MKLTGNEPWVIAAKQGAAIWARDWGGAGSSWRLICDIELDCGLIGIDVCGKREVRRLEDFAELRIHGTGETIDYDDFFSIEKLPTPPKD